MATAYKCDRCGTLYEAFLTPRRITEITVDCHPYPDIWRLQLCDACHNELVDWIAAKGRIKRERLDFSLKKVGWYEG